MADRGFDNGRAVSLYEEITKMTKRYPVCNHTLAAIRNRKFAFKIAAEAIVGQKLNAATLRNLVDAAEMAFAEIDPGDMPIQAEPRTNVGHKGPEVALD